MVVMSILDEITTAPTDLQFSNAGLQWVLLLVSDMIKYEIITKVTLMTDINTNNSYLLNSKYKTFSHN